MNRLDVRVPHRIRSRRGKGTKSPLCSPKALSLSSKEERGHRRRRFQHIKVHNRLLMAFRVLFAPQYQKQTWPSMEDGLSPMHSGMTAGAKRDHQGEDRPAWHAVMDDDLALVSTRSIAHPAPVAIPLKNCLTQAAEIPRVLPFQGIADSTQPVGEDLFAPARAMHRSLARSRHAHITTAAAFPRR